METIIKDLEQILSNPHETIKYAKTLGHFIGLKKEQGKVQVTPQYILMSHFMFPSFIGRTLLITATAAVTWLPEENFQKNNENNNQNNNTTKWFPFGNLMKKKESQHQN